MLYKFFQWLRNYFDLNERARRGLAARLPQWTKSLPMAPGIYWYSEDLSDYEVIEIWDREHCLLAKSPRDEIAVPVKMIDVGWWQGPIFPNGTK